MPIEFDPKTPIYIQIIDLLKRDLVTGKLKGGDKMPSVRELAEKYQVNPNTVQRVYQELERENITYTQRGMGTFVREDTLQSGQLKKEMAEKVIQSFFEGMSQLGFNKKEILDHVKTYAEGSEEEK